MKLSLLSAHTSTGPIPSDLDFGTNGVGGDDVGTIDSSICCNLSATAAATTNRPQSPTAEKF
jgi:hypothetical protein